MTYHELWQRLTGIYDPEEARSIVRWVLDAIFGLSLTDIACGKVNDLSADGQASLEKIMKRLETGEPVQYVLGYNRFCGRTFHVRTGVLIPRPETEELCRRIISEHSCPVCALLPPEPRTILDIGTGSGCIAVTLALDLWPSKVTAWDNSADALFIARENAKRLHATVNFQLQDMLNAPIEDEQWDIIVSNPPYVMEKERQTMARNVLDHEPAGALFVPDDDPLLFYRAEADYAIRALKPGGMLFLELNPLQATALEEMLQKKGFDGIELWKDAAGRLRFCKAMRPLPTKL